jgi:signal transduction histidine kinase
MSNDDSKDEDAAAVAAAGALASGVASELIAPLLQIRDGLAVLVATLDRHFAEAKGPSPYPYRDSKAMREQLAEIYLASRSVTRMTGDLARAIAPQRGLPELVDVNDAVEQALALARHQIGELELRVDFGEVPMVRAAQGELVLLVARLLMTAAVSARSVPGASMAVTTGCRGGDAVGEVWLRIADNGAIPTDDDVDDAELTALARRVAAPLGARFDTGEADGFFFYELALPVK